MTGPILAISAVARKHLRRATTARDNHHRFHAERDFAFVVRWDNDLPFTQIHEPGDRVLPWGGEYFPPEVAS